MNEYLPFSEQEKKDKIPQVADRAVDEAKKAFRETTAHFIIFVRLH